MIVGILGENERSQALATLIAQAGHVPKIGKDAASSTNIRGFQGTPHWGHLCKEADLIILSASASELASHVERANLQPRNHVLVLPGIETNSGQWMSAFVPQHSHAIRVGVLNGVLALHDIQQDQPTALVVGSLYNHIGELTQQVLHSDSCRIYYSSDPIGIEIASIFTKVVHFAIGIADEFDKGPATTGAVASRGLIEGARLAERLGADEHSFLGLSGVGSIVSDLRRSHAYQVGQQVAHKTPMNPTLLTEFQQLLTLNQSLDVPVDLPLTEAMVALGLQQFEPEIIMDKLIRRKATSE